MDKAKLHTTDAFHNRKTQIEDCLYAKLLTTPYNTISVSDLCSDVGISRRAFYHYFEDKDDCLCGVIDRSFRKYMLDVTALRSKKTPLEQATALMEYWKNQGGKFLEIFSKNKLLDLLTMRAIQFAQEEERRFVAPLNPPKVETDEDILSCYLGCQLALLMRWYHRGFDTPTVEMAEKYLRITQNF